MTRSNFGQIALMRSGRFQARYKLGESWVTGPTTYETREDARQWLDSERDRQESTRVPTRVLQPSTASLMTFRQLAEHFLTNKRTRNGPLRPSTVANYRVSLEKLIYPTFEHVDIQDISLAMVDSWYESSSCPERALSKAYATLHAILAYAVDKRWLSTNPANIRSAGQAHPKPHPRPVEVEEIDIITSAMPDNLKAMTLLAYWCALRFGELVALTRDDINLANHTVSINKATVRLKGQVITDRPKTNAGFRTVPIPTSIMKPIRRHLRLYVPDSRDALLFPGIMSGQPMHPSHFRKYFMLATKIAGRAEITGPHQLRRAGLTLYAQAGATIAELQARAGHASPDAAMIYQAATTTRAVEVTTKMDALAQARRKKAQNRSERTSHSKHLVKAV